MRPIPARDTVVLFSDVLSSMDRLLRGEVALAKAEVKQNVRAVRQAAVQFVLAVVFGGIALNLLAGAVVAGLVTAGLSSWVAVLVLGVVLLLFAYACLHWGMWLLDPARLQPRRTFHNLGKDLASFKSPNGIDPDGKDPNEKRPDGVRTDGIGEPHAHG